MDLTKFYKTLFNPGEYVCWGATTYETKVRPIRWTEKDEQFFVINPLKTSRRDENVTSFRNILVEFDKMDLDKQKQFILESGLPYSTLVYSGGKSLHAIISLQWPLTSKEDYKDLVKRVYDRLGGAAIVDTSTSNPSRFSRAPEAVRDNGKIQTLLEVHERIPHAELLQWLGPPPTKKEIPSVLFNSTHISIYAHSFLKYGAPEGQWNSRLFTTCCELFRIGHSLEQVQEKIRAINGYLDSKDRSTILSASKTINRT